MLEVPTWAQSSILIFATDEHIWQISATKVWNREEPPLFCSALPDSQLCSASNTRALRLACSAELAAGWIAVTLPALPVFSPHKAREQLWRPEMNGRSTKESFKFIWIKLERERQECNNSSGSNQKLNWETEQCMWSPNQKLTFFIFESCGHLALALEPDRDNWDKGWKEMKENLCPLRREWLPPSSLPAFLSCFAAPAPAFH